MASLIALPTELRQSILLLSFPDGADITKPWPTPIRTLMHVCTRLRLDMQWVLKH